MNCDNFNQNAALYVYDELEDDLRPELERHARSCKSCGAELEQLRAMKTLFAAEPVEEPSASMLAAARMRLQESLDNAAPAHSWTRLLTFDVAGWMQQLRFSPALSAALLIAGFAGGALTTYRLAPHAAAVPGATIVNPQEASIAGISGITQDPNDPKIVHIKYDRLLPDQAQGSVDDPKIQQLLMFAAQSNRNAGVRIDSVNALAQHPDNVHVREMLIYALRYDKNAGVRFKALDGLRDHVATDTRVRDAVLDALLNDTNPGIRTEAIAMLQPVKADTSVRETLAALAARDKDNSIRLHAKRMLASLPEIE